MAAKIRPEVTDAIRKTIAECEATGKTEITFSDVKGVTNETVERRFVGVYKLTPCRCNPISPTHIRRYWSVAEIKKAIGESEKCT